MKTLIYSDFKSASYRNLIVCRELLQFLPILEPNIKTEILHKVYYLSGYIIECCYKFALFSHISKNKDFSLNKSTNLLEYRKDENFPKKWKTHSFDTLKNLCSENSLIFSSDIPFLGQNKNRELNNLKMRWNTEIRYSLKLTNQEVELSEENLQLFLTEIEKMVEKINLLYN
jgi:hypothetical protein